MNLVIKTPQAESNQRSTNIYLDLYQYAEKHHFYWEMCFLGEQNEEL